MYHRHLRHREAPEVLRSQGVLGPSVDISFALHDVQTEFRLLYNVFPFLII